jgi:diketogulonate reductase-like aldo/keto reductase
VVRKEFPSILYGTAWKKERTTELVEMAIKSGFTGVDTACQPKHYEEPLVGEALKNLYNSGFQREDIFIQTKFTPLGGQDPERVPYNPELSLEEQMEESLEVSLKNLRTEYLDSWIIHSPLNSFGETLKAWRLMEKAVESGKVHHIGVSNLYSFPFFEKLYNEAEIKPSVIQNRFYSQSGYDTEIRKFCLEKGITYQSFWSLTANPHHLNSFSVQKASIRYGVTPAQIWYRFLNQLEILPLIGTTSLQHMREDLAIFKFELEDDEVIEIEALL